ncbi:hypothetical protein DXB25_26635 [Lachnospiraceae bacterium OM02-31]|nr:hypothetical protein DXB25_26635 [Lachnospiraceae bacterium OM02-31]RJW56081.1 hypothetical protein DXB24_18260 [Lachnospiraceae bacterium OM02-3]
MSRSCCPAPCLCCACLLPGKRSPPQILTVPDIPISPGAADKAGEAASSARSHLHGTKRICGGDRFPGRRHTQHGQGAGQQTRDKRPGRPDRAQVTAAGGDNNVYFRVFAKCLHSAAYFLPAGRVKYRCRKGGGSDVGPVPGCTADKNKARVKR